MSKVVHKKLYFMDNENAHTYTLKICLNCTNKIDFEMCVQQRFDVNLQLSDCNKI